MQSQNFARINLKALALAVSLFWAFIVLTVALGNLGLPGYGQDFLETAASIYPGYRAEADILQALLVTFYAAIDGAIAGLAVGWLYNRFGAGLFA